jgi:hypothetical protein
MFQVFAVFAIIIACLSSLVSLVGLIPVIGPLVAGSLYFTVAHWYTQDCYSNTSWPERYRAHMVVMSAILIPAGVINPEMAGMAVVGVVTGLIHAGLKKPPKKSMLRPNDAVE